MFCRRRTWVSTLPQVLQMCVSCLLHQQQYAKPTLWVWSVLFQFVLGSNKHTHTHTFKLNIWECTGSRTSCAGSRTSRTRSTPCASCLTESTNQEMQNSIRIIQRRDCRTCSRMYPKVKHEIAWCLFTCSKQYVIILTQCDTVIEHVPGGIRVQNLRLRDVCSSAQPNKINK